MFSFAKALAENDPEQADKMVEAFEKGYEAARKQWGGELPELCSKTRDAFLQKMDDWKNGKEKENSESKDVEQK